PGGSSGRRSARQSSDTSPSCPSAQRGPGPTPSGPFMTFSESLRRNWFSNLRGDILAGIVVALALIPEAIGFSIIAGVDPKVGLYASVVIAIVISFAGGRPAMISAATAATAVLFGSLVREHGLQYLLAATILAGVLQILAGYL